MQRNSTAAKKKRNKWLSTLNEFMLVYMNAYQFHSWNGL